MLSLPRTPTVGDLLGGLTAAVVALPISLAFGVASGLGPAAGLYGAICCGIFAAAFGGTPGQVSGPTGPMTVVAAALVASHPEEPHLIAASVCCAGLFQMLLGHLRAGQLVNYVPYPVVSGFMSGIGMIIIILQLRPFFGLSSKGAVLDALQSITDLFTRINVQSALVGAITLAAIYIAPRLHRKLPAALAGLLAGTVAATVWNLHGPTIGQVPEGLPLPNLPTFQFHELNIVLFNAISLALLGSIDSLLTSVVVDKIRKTRHDSDKELVGQGIGNLVSGLVGGLPGAGATMRSVVNIRNGGSTNWSGVIHGLLLIAVVMGLGAYTSRIPQACLAAILISVGIGIIDYRGMRSARKAPREDTIVMFVVLFFTVFVDLIVAVGVGVTLASTLFAKRMADIKLTRVGLVESFEHLIEVSSLLPERLRKSIFIYSFNGPLFFAEMRNFTDSIDHLPDARYIILRFQNVPIVDQTAVYAMEDAVHRWRSKGIDVYYVGLTSAIRKTLEDLGLLTEHDHIFEHSEQVIEAIAAMKKNIEATPE